MQIWDIFIIRVWAILTCEPFKDVGNLFKTFQFYLIEINLYLVTMKFFKISFFRLSVSDENQQPALLLILVR